MSTTSTDPIADMLTRVRNAINVRKHETLVPYSKVKRSVADVLVTNGFIDKVETIDLGIGKMLKITIFPENQNARITEITRLSKPGRRWYVSSSDIPIVKRGRGIVVISTSKGLMTGDEAKKQSLGGELICKVY